MENTCSDHPCPVWSLFPAEYGSSLNPAADTQCTASAGNILSRAALHKSGAGQINQQGREVTNALSPRFHVPYVLRNQWHVRNGSLTQALTSISTVLYLAKQEHKQTLRSALRAWAISLHGQHSSSCLCVRPGVAAAVINSWCCCCCSTVSFYRSWVGGWVKRRIRAYLSRWEPPDRRVPMETWPWFSWTGPIVGAERSEQEKKLALGSAWKSARRCMDVCLFLHLRDLENCTKMQNSTEEIN